MSQSSVTVEPSGCGTLTRTTSWHSSASAAITSGGLMLIAYSPMSCFADSGSKLSTFRKNPNDVVFRLPSPLTHCLRLVRLVTSRRWGGSDFSVSIAATT